VARHEQNNSQRYPQLLVCVQRIYFRAPLSHWQFRFPFQSLFIASLGVSC
jgi:hypothetical protein